MKRALEVAAPYASRLVVVAIAVWIALWTIGRNLIVVLPILGAITLARGLTPACRRLRVWGLSNGLAALVTLAGFIAVFVAVLWFAGAGLAAEFDELRTALEDGVDDAEQWFAEREPFGLTESDVNDVRDRIDESSGDFVASAGGSVLTGAFMVGQVALGSILALIVAFFVLKDGASLWQSAVGWARPSQRDVVIRVGERGWAALGAYLRGAMTLGFVEAIVIGVALWLVDGSLVAPVMIVTFVGAFVPILGSITAGVIAVLAAYVTAGSTAALIMGCVALVVQQLDNDLLAPVIYGRALKVHALTVLLGLTAGGALFGFVGTVLAVPVIAVTLNMIDEARHPGTSDLHT